MKWLKNGWRSGPAAERGPGQLRPALFVDKDGCLVDNVPYNVDPSLLRFRPGAVQAVAEIAARGFEIIIVTNQSGLARGYFTNEQLIALRDALLDRFARESSVRIRGFLFCPHAPDLWGLPSCQCRKPLPGMLLEAAELYGIDLERSWMIGDTLDDVEAGRRAGCRSILYESGGETLWRSNLLRTPLARTSEWREVPGIVLESVAASEPAMHALQLADGLAQRR